MNDTAKQPALLLQKIYLKDASLETPMGVRAFRQPWKPRFEQYLQTTQHPVDEQLREVVLTITLRAILTENEKDETAFLVEIQQAGAFRINASNPEQEGRLVNVACPTILFPYVREAVDNLVIKAGFPSPNMLPANFDALYQQALQQKPEAAH